MCLLVSAVILKVKTEPNRSIIAGTFPYKGQIRLAQSMVYNSIEYKSRRLAQRPSSKPCSITTGLPLHLVLRLAADLERNPGPGEFSCSQCHQDVTWSADALQCDGCDLWLHQMNNYIVSSYREVIVITKFAITKYAIRRDSKAEYSHVLKQKTY